MMDCQVTIYTRVYNTEKYLPQCLESVVNQTYRSFRHVIVDNGCTDGCTEILQNYAKHYPWVELIRYEKNRHSIDNTQWIHTPYFCLLDSDGWWEPDYLERLVSFLEENDLDLAVTGTKQYLQEQGVSQIMRKLEQPLIVTQRQFAQNYPRLWTFPSTTWASVQKTSIYKNASRTAPLGLAYGGDTVQMLEYIKQCSRIGIDNSALYHNAFTRRASAINTIPAVLTRTLPIMSTSRRFWSCTIPSIRQNRNGSSWCILPRCGPPCGC